MTSAVASVDAEVASLACTGVGYWNSKPSGAARAD